MIIWGWRAFTFGAGKGHFHCPSCNSERPYKTKKLQRFFTLYFLPIIPLRELQRYVECQQCRQKYKTSVLSLKAEQDARLRELDEAVRAILAHFGRMSGRSDAEFLDQLGRGFTELTGRTVTPDELREDLAKLLPDPGYTTGQLRAFLTENGREIAVRVALLAATADGNLSEEKKAALADFARRLGMSDAHYIGVVASWAPAALTSPAPSPAVPAPEPQN